jgi:hypothetical protein
MVATVFFWRLLLEYLWPELSCMQADAHYSQTIRG